MMSFSYKPLWKLLMDIIDHICNYFGCKVEEIVQHCQDRRDKLGRIDRFAYYAFVNKKYWLAYMYMKLIKQIKSRFFRLFCKLRGSIHRERSK